MSYERLAERLIETQQTMLGQRAVDIAASVDGLSVENDGSVSDVADGDREVVGALVEEYTTIMGGSAASRLESTAAEFEEDLLLPQNLGGPEPVPDDSDATVDDQPTDEPPVSETTDETAPAESDGSAAQPVRKATNPPTIDDIAEPSGSDAAPSRPKPSPSGGSVVESHQDVTKLWEEDDGTENRTDGSDSDADVPGDVDDDPGASTGTADDDGGVTVVEQEAEASGSPDESVDEQDLSDSVDSVYVTRTDEHGWETPVPVGKAITDAVVDATDVDAAEVGDLSTYVDTDRVITLLETDRSIPVSFRVEGHSVTLHPDGDVTVE